MNMISPTGVTLRDLPHDGCRFVLNDPCVRSGIAGIYCAAPVASTGCSYCETHAARVYKPGTPGVFARRADMPVARDLMGGRAGRGSETADLIETAVLRAHGREILARALLRKAVTTAIARAPHCASAPEKIEKNGMPHVAATALNTPPSKLAGGVDDAIEPDILAFYEDQQAFQSVAAVRAAASEDLQISMRQTVTLVARSAGMTLLQLLAPSRNRNLIAVRQMATFVALGVTQCSLPMLARHVMQQDHTTVLYSYRKACERLGLSWAGRPGLSHLQAATAFLDACRAGQTFEQALDDVMTLLQRPA